MNSEGSPQAGSPGGVAVAAPEREPALRRRAAGGRARWFALHGWIGMAFGLWLSLICLSGAVAVFSYEIDWLLDPSRKAAGAEPGEVDWEATKRSLDAAFPYHTISYISGPRHGGFAVQAYARRPDGTGSKIFVDPESGAILAERSFFDVQRFFRSLHRNLFNGRAGILVVTCFAWILLLATASALLFLKRWWRGFLRLRLSRRQLWPSLFREGHRLVGLWSLPLGAVMAATGLWYQLELAAPFSEPRARVDAETLSERPPIVETADLNELARRAEAAIPGMEANILYWQGPAAPLGFAGLRQWWARERANAVQFDPVSGERLRLHRAEELGVHGIVSNAADPLHFGTFGGLPTQALWFLGGLALAALPLTGAVLWYRRHLAERERAQLGRASRWGLRAVPLATLGLFAWIGLGAAEEADSYFDEGKSASVVSTAELGPWSAAVLRYEDSEASAKAKLELGARLGAAGDGTPLAVAVRWRQADETLVEASRSGPVWWAELPAAAAESALRLEVQEPGGAWQEADFAAGELLAKGLPLDGPPIPLPYVWIVSGLFAAACLGVTLAWLRYLR